MQSYGESCENTHDTSITSLVGLLFLRTKKYKQQASANTMMLPLPPLPPPERRIVIVGFLPDNNGRSCELHPFGCGNIVVLQRGDGGVGMLLRVRMIVDNELACFSLNPDGSDGCRVAFAAREYAAGENG